MEQRMTWEEMKRTYPDEWLLVLDCEEDVSGQLLSGVVARHSTDDQEVFHPPVLNEDCTFKYTGESQFPGGWRAHAEHHHF